jgi:hypothetical protein
VKKEAEKDSPRPSTANRNIGNSSINTTAALGSRSNATLDERFIT